MIDPELLVFLNTRLLLIFEGVADADREAFRQYYALLFLETVETIFASGEEVDRCDRAARQFLATIARKVTSLELRDIAVEGAFVWWRKELNALLYGHYRRERLITKVRRYFGELTDREAETVDCFQKMNGAGMNRRTFERIARQIAPRYGGCTNHEIETFLRSAWRKLGRHFGPDWPEELH